MIACGCRPFEKGFGIIIFSSHAEGFYPRFLQNRLGLEQITDCNGPFINIGQSKRLARGTVKIGSESLAGDGSTIKSSGQLYEVGLRYNLKA